MKLLFGTQSWLNAPWILVALLSGPTVVASVWLVAAIAAEAGFVVLPDGAPRFSGTKGREADVTEIVASRDQTGGSLGFELCSPPFAPLPAAEAGRGGARSRSDSGPPSHPGAGSQPGCSRASRVLHLMCDRGHDVDSPGLRPQSRYRCRQVSAKSISHPRLVSRDHSHDLSQ